MLLRAIIGRYYETLNFQSLFPKFSSIAIKCCFSDTVTSSVSFMGFKALIFQTWVTTPPLTDIGLEDGFFLLTLGTIRIQRFL